MCILRQLRPLLQPSDVNALQAFHVMRQAAVIMTSVVMAKSALSTDDIGRWEMLLYIGYTLSFFWVSGLIQGMLTIVPKLELIDRKIFIFNTYLLFLSIGIIIGGTLLWFHQPVINMLTSRANLPHTALFGVYLALHLPVFLLENLYLLWRQPKNILWFGAFSALGHLLSIGIPLWAGMGIEGGVGGLALFAGARHLLLLYFIAKQGLPIFRWSCWRQLLHVSTPLMGYSILGGLQLTLSAWFVARLFPSDEHQFAIFRYGAMELPFTLALTNGLGTAVLPLLADNQKDGLNQLRVQSKRLAHLLFPIAIIIMLSSNWLFPWVFRNAFSESVPIFNIFLMILITRIVFSRTVLTGLQANRVVWWISVAEMFIFVALSAVLGNWLGLQGIAWATLIAYAAEKIMMSVYLHFRYSIRPEDYLEIKIFSVYSIGLLAAYLAVSL